MILTDREIKIYVRRRLITIDPEPDEDIAYQSTAVDLRLDPTDQYLQEAPVYGGSSTGNGNRSWRSKLQYR